MNLTDVEQRLIHHVVNGTVLDLAPEEADEDIDENVMLSWGKPHEIRAEVLRDILRGRHLPDGGPDPHGLQLRGAWIIGRIDLDHITTTIRLRLSSCFLPDGLDGHRCVIPVLDLTSSVITHSATGGAVRLKAAHLGGLSMRDATLTNEAGPALDADGMIVDGNAFLDGAFTAIGHSKDGAVRLPAAHISALSMRDAALTNEAGPALDADGMIVAGNAFLDGAFTAIGHSKAGAVRLMGARIGGQLSMRDATLTNEAGPALHAADVTVEGGAFFPGSFTAIGHGELGAVRLKAAHLSGLLMADATLTNEAGPALDADGMTVDDHVSLSGAFTAIGHSKAGAVRLMAARIGGQLLMRDATLTNEVGPALHADGMTVEGGAFFPGSFTAIGHGELGAVRLKAAHLSGLLMRDATLTNEAGPALHADGMTVAGDVVLDGAFTAIGHGEAGAVRLPAARIGGQLSMRDATLTNEAGPALAADGMTVDIDMFLDGAFTASGHGEDGAVRLPQAHITNRLKVNAASVDRACAGAGAGAGWIVDGLTYDGYPSVGFDKWLALLQSGTTGYRPQPYRQLAGAARAAGHDDDARRALIAQRDDQVKRGDLTPAARAWARFTKFTLGYGYQPWRALLGVAMVLLAAVIIVFFTPGALAQAAAATACTGIETFQIAVDMAIPLVSTSTGTCQISDTPGGQFVSWASVILTLSGWALTALFAAGFTRAIRQP